MSTPEQREPFLRSIRPLEPDIAGLYEAGVRFVEGQSFAGRAPLLAHIVRELRNGIPDAILGRSKGHVRYHDLLVPVHEGWDSVRSALPATAQMENPDVAIPVPLGIARLIDSILKEDAEVAITLRKRFVQMCARVNSEVPWSGNEMLAKQWMNIRVEGIAHRGGGEEADSKAIESFAKLETIILRVFQYAPDREERIRQLALGATPDTILSDLTELVTLHDAYIFFQTLVSTDVLDALSQAGLLTIPVQDSPIYWPPGDYLLNIVDLVPKKVSEVLTSLRPQYPGTCYQLAMAVLKLPDSELLDVARNARWLNERPRFRYLREYIAVIERIIAAGEPELAIAYAKRILHFKKEPALSPLPGFDHPRAVAAIGADWFERTVDDLARSLRGLDPLSILAMYAQALDTAIEIEGYTDGDAGMPSLPNMIASPMARYDGKGQLTGALLVVAQEAAESRPDDVMRFLESRQHNRRTYLRIALATVVRANLASKATELMRSTDIWNLSDPERTALLERFYPDLPERERAAIADIALGALDRLLRPFYERRGVAPELIEPSIILNVARAFGAADSAIPEPLRSRIQRASIELAPEPAPAAPTFDHLAELTPRAVADEIRRWALVSDEPFAAPQWSIGTSLRALLERNGDDWLADLDACRAIPDYFLGWAFNGLLSYRRTSEAPNDEAMLAFIRFALESAAGMVPTEDAGQRGIARHTSQGAGLLLAEIAKTPATVEDINRILNLASLLATVYPTDAGDQRDSPYRAPQSALGDPRGLAVVIAAELLLKAHGNQLDTSAIADLYDSLSTDSGLAVRGALGQYFSWFATTHESRAAAWAERIFISGIDEADRGAWSGYVLFSNVNATTYRLLRHAYELRLLDTIPPTEAQDDDSRSARSDRRDVLEKTIWHIWILIANQVERLDDPLSLATLMLDNSDPDLLTNLLASIGRTLETDGKSEQGPVILEQAMALWSIVRARISEGRYPSRVISGFSLWAKVSNIPAQWRLDEIEGVLDIEEASNAFLGDDEFVDGLIDIAVTHRKRALELILRIARPGNIGALVAIQTNAGPLLREALAGDPEEAHLAKQINSVLVSNHRPNLLIGDDS